MIIVKLMGGLGNQMFQYALGRSLSLYYNTDLKMDISFLVDRNTYTKDIVKRNYDLGIFNIIENFATIEEVQQLKNKIFSNKKIDQLTKNILGKKITYLKEPHFHFFPGVFSIGRDIYLEGSWQSEKYFLNYKKIIRNDFTFKVSANKKTLELLDEISKGNAVCVNVRRGDFLINEYHGTIGLDYYKKSESILKEKINSPHFFIFSDDIRWCRQNLKFPIPTTYVSHEYAGEKFSEYLLLMMHCKHFIIPNSSFGWWAAWLNNNPEKIVIAPKKWFNKGPKDTQDLIPEEWVKI